MNEELKVMNAVMEGVNKMLVDRTDPVECALSAYYNALDREIEEEEQRSIEREIKMQELSEKLFNIKQNALAELRKAQDSIREAYNYVAEYNSEIDFNCAEELIDMTFLDEITRKVLEVERYTQWTTEEKAALEREGYRIIAEGRAA